MLSKPGAKTSTEGINLIEGNLVEHTLGYSNQKRHLFAQGQRLELRLAQHRTNATSMLYYLCLLYTSPSPRD